MRIALRIERFESADIKFNLNKPSTMQVRRLDNSKAKEQLSFEPSVGLDEGLTHVIAWYKENRFIVG